VNEPRVLLGDARHLELPSESVAAAITSPPYNAGVAYEGYDDRIPWPDYLDLISGSCLEMARVLVPSGRVWLNVMRTAPEWTAAPELMGAGRKGHDVGRLDLSTAWARGLEIAGLNYRDTVVWVQDSHDAACAWGSWRTPSAPNLRGGYEVVLVFHKGSWKRTPPRGQEDYRDDLPGWEDLCRNVWKIPPEPRNNHPAPFPAELARRCIRLSTWPGETVLDPFCGSGTTLRAARELGRESIGVDISEAYVRTARLATAQRSFL
jgi:site-specific DNA-methyltransferase (adenine-specific)